MVGFGSTYEKLFAESRAFDQNSLDEATKAVKAVDADLGGTEILARCRTCWAAGAASCRCACCC